MAERTEFPPPARVEIVKDTYFGVTLEDPYRWMEDYKAPELQEWVKAQAAYANDYLQALPTRESFLARIRELSKAGPVLHSFTLKKDRVFYLRRDPKDNLAKLCMRSAESDGEQIVFDPNALEGEVHTAIDWFDISPDGTRAALATSQGGSENSTLQIMDVDSRRFQALEIPRTIFGKMEWLDERDTFLYSRLPEMTPETPPEEYYCNSRIYLHRLGDNGDFQQDPVVLGRGANPEVEFAPIDIPSVLTAKSSPWALGVVEHGDAREWSIYVTRRDSLRDPATIQWTPVAEMEDGIVSRALHGDTIYLRTFKDAARFKVIAVPASDPDLAKAQEIVPPGEAVIQDIKIVGDSLFTLDMVNTLSRMRRVDLDSGAISDVPLPFEGNVVQWTAPEDGGELLFLMFSWTQSLQLFRYDLATGAVTNTGWVPPSPVDFSDIEAHEVLAPGHDGTLIPLSIIHKKGLKLDGSNPTLLRGYGSYGLVIQPAFVPTSLAWLERGGVLAMGHIRGGGAKGREWHEAGRFLNKGNTIDDFISCAEYLIDKGYTNPERLAGQGTSGGGIPSSGSLVKRPDLWAAMIIRVGVTNALRAELSENGPPNIMEFGTHTEEDGFKGLLIIDAYYKVEDGTPYPAVLLTTGINDPRVVVWMATKMAARLQAATTSDNPVLLRAEFHGGHGLGSTREQLDTEQAEIYAFLWEQFDL